MVSGQERPLTMSDLGRQFSDGLVDYRQPIDGGVIEGVVVHYSPQRPAVVVVAQPGSPDQCPEGMDHVNQRLCHFTLDMGTPFSPKSDEVAWLTLGPRIVRPTLRHRGIECDRALGFVVPNGNLLGNPSVRGVNTPRSVAGEEHTSQWRHGAPLPLWFALLRAPVARSASTDTLYSISRANYIEH